VNEAAPGAVPTAPGESEPGISPFTALSGTFTSPANTFAGLVRRPTWWLPLLLWLAGIAVVVLVSTPKIDMERTFREMFEARAAKTGQSMSDQQIREMVARSDRSPAKAAGWALPTSAIMFLFVTLLLWGGARASGSEARFPQVMAVWSHANLPNVVGLLVAIPILASLPEASETQFSIQKALKSNVGAFLPPDVPVFLSSIASSIDIFSLAALGLLVVGMKKLPEMPSGGAVAVPVVLWALYVLGKAAIAAVFLG
jgi:hypothetical protein